MSEQKPCGYIVEIRLGRGSCRRSNHSSFQGAERVAAEWVKEAQGIEGATVRFVTLRAALRDAEEGGE